MCGRKVWFGASRAPMQDLGNSVKHSLLDDLVSRDPHRIWSASHEVIRLRERGLLSELALHVDEIERATHGIELGGALRANRAALEAAIRKLRFAADGARCLCGFYLDYDLFNPEDEAKDGHIAIISQIDKPYAETYVCECNSCHQRYAVERFEYHYPWWKWERQ
jgi:hypothetical protein